MKCIRNHKKPCRDKTIRNKKNNSGCYHSGKEGHIGRSRGRKGKREMLQLYYNLKKCKMGGGAGSVQEPED